MTDAIKIHGSDPNFPAEVIEKAKIYVHDPDIQANPVLHAALIHEMFIEAALIANNSPYTEVRAVVDNADDPALPVSTIRAWLIGVVLVVIGAFINQLFDIRQPSITISSNVAQLVSCEFGSRVAPNHAT